MNFLKYLKLIIVCMISLSCNSPETKNQKISDDALLKMSGCFNVSNEKILEVLNVVFDKNEVSGSGKRSYLIHNELFELSVNGKRNKDGGYDVTIIAKSTMKGRENVSETTYETWILKDKGFEVINRNSSHYIGDLLFVKVNCDGSSVKDESLFDGFFGFHEGYAAVIKNGKWGIVNERWEIIIPCNYRELGNVSEGAVKFYNENKGKYGFLEVPENKILVDAEYLHVTNFSEGYAAVLDDAKGKWGIINRKGEMVVQPKFWSLSFVPQNPYVNLFNEGLANVAIADAKWGYINTKLEEVLPFEYMFAEPFKDGMARVNKNGRDFFYIDKSGKCVKDCK
jgi:hypothetical protein